jgi:plasmid stability protein
MGQALIRKLDDALLADYRDAAVRNQRSLEAELRDALARARPITPKRRDELLERLAKIRAMTPKGVKQTPAEVLVREDRDGNRG